MIWYIRGDFLNVEHLLEYRIGIIEKFRVQSHIHEKTLSHICYITFFVGNDIFLVELIELRFYLFHVIKYVVPLNESNKDNFLIDLRKNFNYQLNFS